MVMKRLGLVILPAIAVSACMAGSSDDATSGASAVEAKRPPVAKVPQSPEPFTTFESLQVRPLALSADGKTLFALNTPDNRLEIFQVTDRGVKALASVEVGLEPVALALRGDSEVWVVNHLSDSVSIVRLDDGTASTLEVARRQTRALKQHLGLR